MPKADRIYEWENIKIHLKLLKVNYVSISIKLKFLCLFLF